MRERLLGLHNPELAISADVEPEAIRVAEQDRVLRVAAVAVIAANIPRRIGADFSTQELSADKKLCRQIAHAYLRLARLWSAGKQSYGVTPEMGSEAATIIWGTWGEEQCRRIIRRKVYIATWGVKLVYPQEAMSFIHRLDQEEQEIKRLLIGDQYE